MRCCCCDRQRCSYPVGPTVAGIITTAGVGLGCIVGSGVTEGSAVGSSGIDDVGTNGLVVVAIVLGVSPLIPTDRSVG